MDQEKSPNRTKRQTKVTEDYWDCSVCTYRNTAEAFKCSMCDIRKGTSTRKPRINPQLVAQQAAPQFGGPPPVKVSKKEDKDSDQEKEKEKPMDGKKEKPTEGKKRKNKEGKSTKKAWRTPRLKNVDRSTAQTREITVNNVSVLITEYKLKKKKASDACSTTSEGSHTDTSTDTRSGEVANDTRSS